MIRGIIPSWIDSVALTVPRRGVVYVAMMTLGCGGGIGAVSGRITHNGEVLRSGTVQIECSDGTVHVGQISTEGKYFIPDVPVGPARFAVTAVDQTAMIQSARRLASKAQPSLTRLGKDRADVKSALDSSNSRTSLSLIPNHYGDFLTSGLTLEVRKGSNAFDIDLR